MTYHNVRTMRYLGYRLSIARITKKIKTYFYKNEKNFFVFHEK